MKTIVWMFVLTLIAAKPQAFAANDPGKVTEHTNGVTSIKLAPEKAGAVDFKNAKELPLPISTTEPDAPYDALQVVEYPGEKGFEQGAVGSGVMKPQILFDLKDASAPASQLTPDEIVEPQEFGTLNLPYTESRVDVVSSSNNVSRLYPFRAAGKLYFKIGTANYICSGSLIKKGLLVTAAHCVADFGKRTFHNSYVFAPAFWNTTAPYGTWNGLTAYALTSYLNGTSPCATGSPGVICRDDVAVIVLAPRSVSPAYPGTVTGWFGYGWNGWGFTPTTPRLTLVNQLGYPASHDGGLRMQRNDAQGYVSTTLANNTVWGSRLTGGSSGGPVLSNLGMAAVLSGIGYGTYSSYNTVIGVTSWGYTNTSLKAQGASPFLSTNITTLVNAACAAYPAACAP